MSDYVDLPKKVPRRVKSDTFGIVHMPADFWLTHYPLALVPKQLNVIVQIDGSDVRVVRDGVFVPEKHAVVITQQAGTGIYGLQGLWMVCRAYKSYSVLGWSVVDRELNLLRWCLSSNGRHAGHAAPSAAPDMGVKAMSEDAPSDHPMDIDTVGGAPTAITAAAVTTAATTTTATTTARPVSRSPSLARALETSRAAGGGGGGGSSAGVRPSSRPPPGLPRAALAAMPELASKPSPGLPRAALAAMPELQMPPGHWPVGVTARQLQLMVDALLRLLKEHCLHKWEHRQTLMKLMLAMNYPKDHCKYVLTAIANNVKIGPWAVLLNKSINQDDGKEHRQVLLQPLDPATGAVLQPDNPLGQPQSSALGGPSRPPSSYPPLTYPVIPVVKEAPRQRLGLQRTPAGRLVELQLLPSAWPAGVSNREQLQGVVDAVLAMLQEHCLRRWKPEEQLSTSLVALGLDLQLCQFVLNSLANVKVGPWQIHRDAVVGADNRQHRHFLVDVQESQQQQQQQPGAAAAVGRNNKVTVPLPPPLHYAVPPVAMIDDDDYCVIVD